MMNYEYPGDVDGWDTGIRGKDSSSFFFFSKAILGSQIGRQIQQECAVVRVIDFYLSL